MSNPPGPSAGVQGITEQDIANYLANTPGFFERHAELLAAVQIASPHGNRAVSLQQRQMEMLRERIKGLERKIMEMIRSSQENAGIGDRLHRWTLSIMLAALPQELPAIVTEELKIGFLIPQVAVRLWDVDPCFADHPFAHPVSDDARSFAGSLPVPYCGVNSGFEAVQWLDEPASVASLAMIPLKVDEHSQTFGLLVLASPDPTRFAPDMGIEFLQRIGELAGAGLARLLPG